MRLAFDDARPDDERERVAGADGHGAGRDGGDRVHHASDVASSVLPSRSDLLLVGGADKAGKQRMRLERPRLELGMELHGQEPGMTRQLGDLDELAVGRSA